jgi:hypothetical protein
VPFANHYRLSMSGVLTTSGSAYEIFSYGVNINDSGVVDINTTEIFNDMVADAVAFHGRAGTRISQNCVLTQVKLAPIGPLGLYRGEPRIAVVSQPGGTLSGLFYPPQVALAVSLMTARRGPTGKGRFFLPATTVNLDPASTIPIADAEAVRGSVQTFLNALNNLPGFDNTGSRVVVASSKGYNTDVNGVRVGRVLDTIRSRRNQILEKYTASVPVS